MEEGDEAEDKADEQKDDHAMEGDTAQQEHDQLKQLITHHQKLLWAKKQLLSDEKAASTMFDLECLNCYNEMRLKKQQETITNAKPCHRALLKVKIKSIQPTIYASQQVAQLVAKSDSFACHLRSMAHHLQWLGELLENNQGKGACYDSHGLFSFLPTPTPLWLISLMFMTHRSHTYSTLTHISHVYDSSFPHQLHYDSFTPIILLLYIQLDTHL